MSDERRPKILLVCGDEPLLFDMHRTLYADNELYDVLLASNVAVARQILRDQRIDVLVSDEESSATPGPDLVTWVAREAPGTRMLLLMGVDARLGSDDPLGRASVRCLGKAVDAIELRRQVRNAIDPEEALTGKLATMPFADLIQLLCDARKSTAVHVRSPDGRALILIAKGRIVHAQSESESGIDVLGGLVGLREGTFYLAPFPEDYQETMSGEWKHMLMEAAYRLDEHQRQRPTGSRSPAQPHPPPAPHTAIATRARASQTDAAKRRDARSEPARPAKPYDTLPSPTQAPNPRSMGAPRERGRAADSMAAHTTASGRATSSMGLLPQHRRRPPDSQPRSPSEADVTPVTSRWPLSGLSSGLPSESAIDAGWAWAPEPEPPSSASSLAPPERASAVSDPSQARGRAARRGPNQIAAALVDRGFVALHAGDLETACKLWSEAYRMDPENRTLALNLRKLDAKKQRTLGQSVPPSEAAPHSGDHSPPTQPEPGMAPLTGKQSQSGR